MANKKRLAINMVSQMVVFFVNLLVSFILTPYVTEHVGKDVYGFVNLAFQFTGYVSLVTTALNGMASRFITVSYHKGEKEKANMYFSSVMAGNFMMSAILLIPSICLVVFMEHVLQVPSQHLLDVKLLWGFIFANFLVSMYMGGYSVSTYVANRLDLSAKRSLENKLLYAAVLFGCFFFFDAKIWYIGLANFLCGFYLIVTNIHYTRKLTPELHFSKAAVKISAALELIKVGIWNTVQQLASILINGCDMLITNLYIDAVSMTMMGYAKTIPGYLMSIIGIVCGSFAPEMTILYSKGDVDAFIKYVKSAIKVCGFICSIPILGFVVFGSHFFHLWLPSLDTGDIRMVQILSVMILAQTIFDVYIYPLYTVNQITCKLRMPVFVSLGIGVANIIGSIVLCQITDLGVYAIQIVSSVLLTARVFFFAPIYAAHILRQKWYIFYGPLLRGTVSSAIVVIVFVIVNRFVTIENWLHLVVVAIPCAVIGYAINYLVVLDRKERIMVKEMIQKKLKKQKNA